jgi:hypothetical protein
LINLWDNNYGRVINTFWDLTINKEKLHRIDYLFFYFAPISLLEPRREAIHPRRLKRAYLEQGIDA